MMLSKKKKKEDIFQMAIPLKIVLKMVFNRPLSDRRPAGNVARRRATKWKNEEEFKKMRIGQK